MKILLTGATGFLGWHTRARLRALTGHQVVAVGRSDWASLAERARGIDAIIHIAGVNRASDAEIVHGNINLAKQVADAARATGIAGNGSAPRIVYANSIQSGNDSAYGMGKNAASEILAKTAADIGSSYVDVRLPNLFGEHGRPNYNSFVATFVHAIVNGETPQITDRPVDLLHVQQAAHTLTEALTTGANHLAPSGTPTTVRDVFETLHACNTVYSRGEIPALPTALDVDLFNTLRAARFPVRYPMPLNQHIDSRGSLVEVVRSHGGQGQTFVSTTRPGITRGDHFHLRKVERFVVVSGAGRICLRRLFSTKVVSFDVTGENASIVDIPTMWTHSITNTGPGELTTLFWSNELFDHAAPDTFPETVEHAVPGPGA